MPKSVVTGQLQYHWESRKIAIQISLMKSQREQREPPQPRLAVPERKVTPPKGVTAPRVRAGSGQGNYAAEAQDQKWGYELRNGVSTAKPKPTVVRG